MICRWCPACTINPAKKQNTKLYNRQVWKVRFRRSAKAAHAETNNTKYQWLTHKSGSPMVGRWDRESWAENRATVKSWQQELNQTQTNQNPTLTNAMDVRQKRGKQGKMETFLWIVQYRNYADTVLAFLTINEREWSHQNKPYFSWVSPANNITLTR